MLILIFGEISPKTMATLRAEKISLRFCNIIWLLMKVLTPVIFIINHLAMLVLRLMGVKASEGRQAMTEVNCGPSWMSAMNPVSSNQKKKK